MTEPRIEDPFALLNTLRKTNRRLFGLLVVSSLVNVIVVLLAAVSFVKPLPTIVRPSDPAQAIALVSPKTRAENPISEADAKRFLHHMTSLLEGWTSLSVDKQFIEAISQMDGALAERFRTELSTKVEIDPELEPSGKATLLMSYRLARIRNTLEFDWTSASCSPSTIDGKPSSEPGSTELWHCKIGLERERNLLVGSAQPQREKFVAYASFVEVPFTPLTLHGLRMTAYELRDK